MKVKGSSLTSDRVAAATLPKLPTSIQEAFSLAVRRNPGATVLLGRAPAISHGELDHRSDVIARRLIDMGLIPGARGGLYAQRSVETIIALIAGTLNPLTL